MAKLHVEALNRLILGEISMRKLIALGVIAAALATAACNTVAGMGRDLEAAGQAVTSSSNSARN
jgi:predicted small secreted protein